MGSGCDQPVGHLESAFWTPYNPWVALYWLVAGKTLGGAKLYPEANRLDRMTALRLFTVGSSWFSSEDGKKGAIIPGQLADLAILSADYFSVPEEQIKQIESVLTIVDGKVVFGAGEFALTFTARSTASVEPSRSACQPRADMDRDSSSRRTALF